MTVFERFLSSKLGRGVLAAAGGSGGGPVLIPKPFKNCQKRLRKRFLESFSTFLGVAGEFLESFLRLLGGFLAGFEKVAKTAFLIVFVEILINRT